MNSDISVPNYRSRARSADPQDSQYLKAKPARRTQRDKEYQLYAHSIQPQPSSVSYHMYLLQEMSL